MNCIFDNGKCALLGTKTRQCLAYEIPCSFYNPYKAPEIKIPERLNKALKQRRIEMQESEITICGHGGGTPSKKNLKEYCSKRYAEISKNKKHKGLIAVRRLKVLDNSHRTKFVSKYNTILGRNIYSQNLRNYVYTKYPQTGKYYSDCSSSGMATFRNIGYTKVPMLNTAGIYQSQLFEDVPAIIKHGHIQNPEVLKVGDCLLFVGEDPSRPLQIGHVEYVYKLNNGKQPKKHKVALPTLRKGDKGDEVKLLQNNLNSCKLTSTKIAEDGDFGPKTDALLKVFQKKYKLVVDGIYGIKSANKMCDIIGAK